MKMMINRINRRTVLIFGIIILALVGVFLFTFKPLGIVTIYYDADVSENALQNGGFDEGSLTSWSYGSTSSANPTVASWVGLQGEPPEGAGDYFLYIAAYDSSKPYETSYQAGWIAQGVTLAVTSTTYFGMYTWIMNWPVYDIIVTFSFTDTTDYKHTIDKGYATYITIDLENYMGKTIDNVKIELTPSGDYGHMIDEVFLSNTGEPEVVTTEEPEVTTEPTSGFSFILILFTLPLLYLIKRRKKQNA